MSKETRALGGTFEIRADEGVEEGNTAFGLAAPFSGFSHDFGDWKEEISPAAFDASLAAVEAGEHRVSFLWSHDSSQPLCSTRTGKLKLAKSEEGLTFEADVSSMTPLMRSALADGDMAVSIGFSVNKDTWERVEGDSSVEFVRTLEEVKLIEVSLVLDPAYPQTNAVLRSLDAFKEEFRKEDNVDTAKQLRRLQYLRLSIRGTSA